MAQFSQLYTGGLESNDKRQLWPLARDMQDSLGFWNPRREFRIPGSGFHPLSVELGFWISIESAGSRDSSSEIFPDSGIYDSLTWDDKCFVIVVLVIVFRWMCVVLWNFTKLRFVKDKNFAQFDCNRDSGIREIFACEIQEPRLWNTECSYRQSGIPLKIGICNPRSSDMEHRIQYLESEIHSVESRIQYCLGFTFHGHGAIRFVVCSSFLKDS